MITLRYTTVDRHHEKKTFKTLAGAKRYAQKWVGEHPEFGSHYAISSDGIGKIEILTMDTCSYGDLFPVPVASFPDPEVIGAELAKAEGRSRTALTRESTAAEVKALGITPLELLAINAICDNNGCGAVTKAYLKQDNMTWFNGQDLMDTLGVTWQGAGGLIHTLLKKGLAFKADNRKVSKEHPNPANYCLSDKAIDLTTSLGD